jgi:hypothetical protein
MDSNSSSKSDYNETILKDPFCQQNVVSIVIIDNDGYH